LQDAVRGVFGEVVAGRRGRSEPLISARETARAEIKGKAFDSKRGKVDDTRLVMSTALAYREEKAKSGKSKGQLQCQHSALCCAVPAGCSYCIEEEIDATDARKAQNVY
jgi:hypothetical protein